MDPDEVMKVVLTECVGVAFTAASNIAFWNGEDPLITGTRGDGIGGKLMPRLYARDTEWDGEGEGEGEALVGVDVSEPSEPSDASEALVLVLLLTSGGLNRITLAMIEALNH